MIEMMMGGASEEKDRFLAVSFATPLSGAGTSISVINLSDGSINNLESTGTTGTVQSVKFSPDGGRLYAASWSAPGIRVYDTDTWGIIPGTPSVNALTGVDVNADGGRVLFQGNSITYVYDTDDWSLVRSVGDSVSVATFAPDGQNILYSVGNQAILFNPDTNSKETLFTTGFSAPSVRLIVSDYESGMVGFLYYPSTQSTADLKLRVYDSETWSLIVDTVVSGSYGSNGNSSPIGGFFKDTRFFYYARDFAASIDIVSQEIYPGLTSGFFPGAFAHGKGDAVAFGSRATSLSPMNMITVVDNIIRPRSVLGFPYTAALGDRVVYSLAFGG